MTSAPSPLILVTGAAGKVGRAFVDHLLADAEFAGWRVRALCHQRPLPAHERVESVFGAIQDRPTVIRPATACCATSCMWTTSSARSSRRSTNRVHASSR